MMIFEVLFVIGLIPKQVFYFLNVAFVMLILHDLDLLHLLELLTLLAHMTFSFFGFNFRNFELHNIYHHRVVINYSYLSDNIFFVEWEI